MMMSKDVTRKRHNLSAALLSVGLLTMTIGGQCPNTVPPPGPPAATSFAADIQPIFDASCISCHATGGIADLILHLNSGESFAALVNAASVQNAALTLVVPSNSTSSLLLQKVSSGSPPVGARMPILGFPLSQADLDAIENWIDQGAMNN
jgi:hypothetical protein